jgi:hypothetical protein|tara:strand:- start:30776 stop:31009 length:234 start_codon:yes stop_codon:yes gene_type:complete
MAANKEEQKPQKASKYYPAEDVAVPKKVRSHLRQFTAAPRRGGRRALWSEHVHDTNAAAMRQRMMDAVVELYSLELC